MIWLVLFAIGAIAFFGLGWPVDKFARDESARSGLLWAALTLGLPTVVWFIVGLIAQSHDKTGEVAFGLVFLFGAASSCAAIVAGTLTARTVRSRRLR